MARWRGRPDRSAVRTGTRLGRCPPSTWLRAGPGPHGEAVTAALLCAGSCAPQWLTLRHLGWCGAASQEPQGCGRGAPAPPGRGSPQTLVCWAQAVSGPQQCPGGPLPSAPSLGPHSPGPASQPPLRADCLSVGQRLRFGFLKSSRSMPSSGLQGRFRSWFSVPGASLVAQLVKSPPAMQENPSF